MRNQSPSENLFVYNPAYAKQAHLWEYAKGLPSPEKEAFLRELSALPVECMASLYAESQAAQSKQPPVLSPAGFSEKKSQAPETLASWEAEGFALLEKGAVAAVTMAGGQGTRLGFGGPKGCLDIGVGASLFALQAIRLSKLSARAGKTIPWYIMTSEENHPQTVAFFEENAYFSYPKEDIFFFRQGCLPLLLPDGRMFLNAPGRMAVGPDGNGGVFAALAKSGALEDMRRRGVAWIFFCGIDNALVKMADPVLLGFVSLSGARGASKSVAKTDPSERVGVFGLISGRPGIVEYFELPSELANLRDEQGSLVYGDANIISHVLALSVLEEICHKGLPYHVARKKEPVFFPNPANLQPEAPNALKFETFIFDAFVFLDEMAILRCERNEEFAPVKNSQGADSPATALALYRALYGDMLA